MDQSRQFAVPACIHMNVCETWNAFCTSMNGTRKVFSSIREVVMSLCSECMVGCYILWCIGGSTRAGVHCSRENSHLSTSWCHAGPRPATADVVCITFKDADSEFTITWALRNHRCYSSIHRFICSFSFTRFITPCSEENLLFKDNPSSFS